MTDPDDWIQHSGGARPVDGDTPIIARIRCRSREDLADAKAIPAKLWLRWTHDNGPGDLVEFRREKK